MGEYNKKQPTINLGTIGQVAEGKSSLVEAISNTDTRRYAKERETNKTVKLGYTNAMIYKCAHCPSPQCYQSGPSTDNEFKCNICDRVAELKRHVSFVDSPGHNKLMSTLLNGVNVMHSAFMVVSADNKLLGDIDKKSGAIANLPVAPQTAEHMIAAEIMDLDICVCFNKMDLVPKKESMKRLNKLKDFMKNTKYENAQTIPISANFGANIDVVCQYIVECIPEPVQDCEADAEMVVIRSFNINGQHIPVDEIQGGVVGGSLIKGKLRLDDEVTVVPGFVVKNSTGDTSYIYQPIKTRVVSMGTGTTLLEEAVPGGLISTKLTIDPNFTSQDKLIGNIILVGDISRYKVFETFTIKYYVIHDLAKVSAETSTEIHVNDLLIINCNAKNITCKVLSLKKKTMELQAMTEPICVKMNGKITLSKQTVSEGPRLIGYGNVKSGTESKMM